MATLRSTGQPVRTVGVCWWRECIINSPQAKMEGLASLPITVASEGDNSRGGAKGAGPGRVREGGTPPA